MRHAVMRGEDLGKVEELGFGASHVANKGRLGYQSQAQSTPMKSILPVLAKLRLNERMDDVMKVIDDALKAKGLKDATASKLAVGHPSLIKNMRNARASKEEPRYSIKNLERLAEVLGLELYFGPPRPAPSPRDIAHQLAEQASEFRRDRWVLPLVDLPKAPTIPRLALPQRWLDDHGIHADHAALVEQPDTSMEPGIPRGATVLIDTSLRDVAATPGKVFAVELTGTPQLRRCDMTPHGMIARADNPHYPASITPRDHIDKAPILGRVRAVISKLD